MTKRITLILSRGLSPRSRGSHSRRRDGFCRARSIPALAGKPARQAAAETRSAVYPRARGEAVDGSAQAREVPGLSPRSRGSHQIPGVGDLRPRSIPALAGKPEGPSWRTPGSGVYPRARGEARTVMPGLQLHAGLSPRSRGSPRRMAAARRPGGSIPALAGKPIRVGRLHCLHAVYPRARGEAHPTLRKPLRLEGLSPRSRGSQLYRRRPSQQPGSIPALAGKPFRSCPPTRPGVVYPRARGEARLRQRGDRRHEGLSPRSRGSHHRRPGERHHAGSIPALAGKPERRTLMGIPNPVYPRARGEARGRLATRL